MVGAARAWLLLVSLTVAHELVPIEFGGKTYTIQLFDDSSNLAAVGAELSRFCDARAVPATLCSVWRLLVRERAGDARCGALAPLLGELVDRDAAPLVDSASPTVLATSAVAGPASLASARELAILHNRLCRLAPPPGLAAGELAGAVADGVAAPPPPRAERANIHSKLAALYEARRDLARAAWHARRAHALEPTRETALTLARREVTRGRYGAARA